MNKVRATQHFIKDKMTGRVDILRRIFEKSAKKLKMKSQERKNVFFFLNYSEHKQKNCAFLGPVTTILTVFQLYQQYARVSFGLL